MNYITTFDCETTGLPMNWKAPMTDIDNWPRVIQLAWITTDDQDQEITRGKYLIKPDGWIMPDGKFWVDNGFSQLESATLGIPISDVLDLFIKDLEQSKYLVSHNMSFDQNVVGAEMLRLGKTARQQIKICTKEIGTDVCCIPFNERRYSSAKAWKWPKLPELHQYLFNKGFEGAHDALSDVIACKDCFFELVRRDIIKLN